MLQSKQIKIALITPIEDSIPVQVSAYKAWMPRYGSVAIAQSLSDNGYEVRHYCEHSGSVIDWDYVLNADYVCFSLMTFCACKGYEMSDMIRRKSKATIIYGGCHCTVAPEDSLEHSDYVVRNEGEATLLELLECLEKGKEPSGVLGLSYRNAQGEIVHNSNRPFIGELDRSIDISLIEGYPPNTLGRFIWEAVRKLRIPRISLPVAQSSRGCVHKCKFCMVKHELGSAYRMRSPGVVLDEIHKAFERLGSRTVFFVDNDFTHNTEHAISILEPLADRYGKELSVYFFSRIDLAKKPALLDVLSRIHSVYLGLGFESTNEETLSQFSKGQSQKEFQEDIRIIHDRGFHIHGLFIFGGEADTEKSLSETVDFAVRNKLYTVGFSALYDIPGKEKTIGLEQLIPDHRFIHRDWRLFTGHFVVFFPREIRPSQLQRKIIEGQKQFFRRNRETFFQYFPVYASSEKYIGYLEEQEKGLYDENDVLIEERLAGRTFESLPRSVAIKPSRLIRIREVSEFILQNMFRSIAWKMLARNFRSGGRRSRKATPQGMQV